MIQEQITIYGLGFVSGKRRGKWSSTTLSYPFKKIRGATITILHELLHAFSLSGCNKDFYKVVLEGRKDHDKEESFIQAFDDVMEWVS